MEALTRMVSEQKCIATHSLANRRLTQNTAPACAEFHVGQKYNSKRDSMAGVQDEVETTLTTQGYLTDGQ
jgi:hypothetical protein